MTTTRNSLSLNLLHTFTLWQRISLRDDRLTIDRKINVKTPLNSKTILPFVLGSPGIAQHKHYTKKLWPMVNSWRVTNSDVSATGSWIDRNRRADQWWQRDRKNNTVFWDRQSLALVLSLNTVSISFTMQFYFLSSPIVDECPSKRILHTRAFTNVSDSCRLHSFASERPLQCFAPKRVGTRNVEERAEFYSQDTHELELASN